MPLRALFLVMKYLKVLSLCLNFRLITVKVSGVRKFRNFRVPLYLVSALSFLTVLLQTGYQPRRDLRIRMMGL